jgi:hypothetical protein
MRYETARAFRTALETRLRSEAEKQAVSVNRLRKRVVFDRLLARLVVLSPDGWIVKGGVALELRLGDRARATRDLDLVRAQGSIAAIEDLVAAQQLDLDDYFSFTIEQRPRSKNLGEDIAMTFHVRADVNDRLFDDITIDVGWGDRLEIVSDRLPGIDLLRFADIARSEVLAMPVDRHVAEKLHA